MKPQNQELVQKPVTAPQILAYVTKFTTPK